MIISVVIPFYNEEESLKQLYKQIIETLSTFENDFELIFIDDGSTDSSNTIVGSLRGHNPKVRLITFRRNQGKSAALAVGFKAATGKYVVTLDADLQDDPSEIHNLIQKCLLILLLNMLKGIAK